MARIPEETIDQVIASTDIVDLIMNGYGIPLQRSGSSFKACCPFHNENTPSFHVSPDRQRYKCFGCGEGGGVVNFVMSYENLTFVDAVKKLAQRSSIPIIEEAYDPRTEKLRKQRSRLVELHSKLTEWMHQQLLTNSEAQHARDYLASRGYDMEMAKRWKVGWIPERSGELIAWAKKAGFSAKDFIGAGVAAQKNEANPKAGVYFRFRNRLMFPINNDHGDPIAFTARQLVADPKTGKYINSPETVLFNKSKTVFGLEKARRPILKAKYALLCEGQMDVIACAESGFEHAIACSGTAFTADHAKILKKYTGQVCVCFDGDSAGQNATRRAFAELAKVNLDVKVVSLPDKHDPDSYIKKYGAESFRQMLANSESYLDYRIRSATQTGALSTPDQRVQFSKEIAEDIAHITDSIQSETYCMHVASRLNIDSTQLASIVVDLKKQSQRQAATSARRSRMAPYNSSEEDPYQDSPPQVKAVSLHPQLEALITLIINSKKVQERVIEKKEDIKKLLGEYSSASLVEKILKRGAFRGDLNSWANLLDSIEPNEKAGLQRLPELPSTFNFDKAFEENLYVLKGQYLHELRKRKIALRNSDDTEDELKPILKKEILDLEAQLQELPKSFRLNFK